MSIVDAIGTAIDNLANRIGGTVFHETGRPVPTLRFAAAENAARIWAEEQSPDMLKAVERFIQRDAGDYSVPDLIRIGNELRLLGYPEQSQYFAELNGARGWIEGFATYRCEYRKTDCK